MKKLLVAMSLLAISDKLPDWRFQPSTPPLKPSPTPHRFTGIAAKRREVKRRKARR